LVTGASSGIGRAMAVQLAQEGTALVVVARDQARLEALASELAVDCEVIVCDLADRDALEVVERRIEASESPVDLVVNNAGLGFGGPFASIDRDAASFVVDVNVAAVQRLTHAAATAFQNRGRGAILNVGSLAGEAVGANSATYNATKAFVTSLGQSLAVELAGTGVTITTLLPGLDCSWSPTAPTFPRRSSFSIESGSTSRRRRRWRSSLSTSPASWARC